MALKITKNERFEDLKLGEGFAYIDGDEYVKFDYERDIIEEKLKLTPKGQTLRIIFVHDRTEEGIEVSDTEYDIRYGKELETLRAVRMGKNFLDRMIEDRYKTLRVYSGKIVPEEEVRVSITHLIKSIHGITDAEVLTLFTRECRWRILEIIREVEVGIVRATIANQED